jgi:hypothetical protein
MDKPKTTPKDFFLWAGAMVALYAGVFSFVGLLFDYINYVYPDTALMGYYTNPYQGSISYEMASLIVLAPVFLVLMRLIRRSIQADPSRREVWVRRWALFLTLFVAGATIIIDLITLINTFLQGEDLSTRFLLKILIVLLVAAAGFMHFVADVWGYWEKNPRYALSITWAVAALIVLTILSGFIIIGTPQTQRAYRIDEQRVSDLQGLQYQVLSYWQRKQALPATLSALNDPLSNYSVPTDPQTGAQYEYKSTSALSFELCATFGAVSQSLDMVTTPEPAGLSRSGSIQSDSWQHAAGRACFVRTIDPQLYPPIKQ